jgi:mannose-6-phosphate isomerase-like protein (cupin superfamily)
MTDSTVKKIDSAYSPAGHMGQLYLASGKRVSMRLWEDTPANESKTEHTNTYETVGFALSGEAVLEVAGQTVTLKPGDSWLVPAETPHRYRIVEPFSAVEATSPPAHAHGRDEHAS